MILPIAIPLLIATAVVRLSFQTRASKERIRLLKEDGGEEKMASMIRSVEKKMDDVIADLVDSTSPTDSPSPEEAEAESSSTVVSPSAKWNPSYPLPSTSNDGKKSRPALSPSQIRMIDALNSLDFLKKEVAFIPAVRNAHAVLICRDPKNFPHHEEGKGAIRHWADRFLF
jgi:hypothetical protein